MVEKIFLSYAHQDREFAEQIAKRFKEPGPIASPNPVILDSKDIPAGANIREAIKDQIASADKIVIIASPSAKQSQWVNYEAGVASALGKPIIVVNSHEMAGRLLPNTIEGATFVTLPQSSKKNWPHRKFRKPSEVVRNPARLLFKNAKYGDKEAKRKIVEANIRLIAPIARKYQRRGVELLDLMEEGGTGLMHAVKRFNPRKGFRFSAYASYWVEQSIRRAVEQKSKLARPNQSTQKVLRKRIKEFEKMHAPIGRDPSLAGVTRGMRRSTR